MRRLVMLALPVIGLSLTTLQLHAQWTEFRGPNGSGPVAVPVPFGPLNWGEGTNVRWKTAIHGRGWSSPIVLGNQVWMTTATEDGRQLYGVAVDRESGKIIYDLKLFEVATL